ncbi:MAG TPA: glycosyltransferase [Gemmatimonadaceae bacterium]|jgi:glycosyltransferase involved in cell wall biosynthesis|nr:glycosyltransferase [Gemmatimonadaceae bacterium]
MRVLHVMPDLARSYGGPIEALIGFVEAFLDAGGSETAVTIAGPTAPNGELDWLRAQMPGATIITASRLRVPRLVRRLAPAADVVHVHGLLNPVSSGGAGAALARERPLIIGPFGTLSRYTFTHRRAVLKRLYFLSVDAPHLRRAAVVHFTTAAERDEAAWHGIDFGNRAHVVPPPWRGGTLGPAVARTGETVLFLSRLHPKKGLELLLEAWPAVRRVRPGARLVIAGAGEPGYTATLRRAADGVDGIEFVGFVAGDAKAARLAGADVFVLPSFNENFGIAVLEAVAAGLPVVVSPGVQLAPWVESRAVGRVAARAPDALAIAIDGTLRDAALRARVAQCGAGFVVEDFGPARVAPALLSMYVSSQTQSDRT